MSLAQLSTDCLKQKGRPYRIAVDEAAWRFNNLTPQQVALIKQKEERARPVEKAIFHRIVSLLQLNIQLLFVFDGAKRPWKRNKRGGGVDRSITQETRDLLRHLSVPQHEAPGEAEAECARLQQEGIVDAVWTDDGDAFMFGTTTLIKTHREKSGAKSQTHVKLFHAGDIKTQYGLDQEGFVLFALLAGGDYATEGLPGCGPKTAMKFAKQGLGQHLGGKQNSKAEMQVWRAQLKDALKGKCEVPPTFPNMRALKYYTTPTISNSEQIRNLRGLHKGWDVPLNETKLRVFLRTHYNIQVKGYLKHIVPILLLRTLCATTQGLERTNNMYGVELARTRKKKDENVAPIVLERKITYLPQSVTSLDLSSAPLGETGEDWTPLAGKDGTPFDAKARTDCEMLEYALQRGVPHVLQKVAEDAVKPPVSKNRKSVAIDLEDDNLDPKPARKRKVSAEKENIEPSTLPRSKAKKAIKPEALVEASNEQPQAPRPAPAIRMPPSWTDMIVNERNPFEHPQYLKDVSYLQKHPSVGQAIGRSAERRPPSVSQMAVVDRVMAVIHEGVVREVASDEQTSRKGSNGTAKELPKPLKKSRKSTGVSIQEAIVLD